MIKQKIKYKLFYIFLVALGAFIFCVSAIGLIGFFNLLPFFLEHEINILVVIFLLLGGLSFLGLMGSSLMVSFFSFKRNKNSIKRCFIILILFFILNLGSGFGTGLVYYYKTNELKKNNIEENQNLHELFEGTL